jgi:hypothetical protein
MKLTFSENRKRAERAMVIWCVRLSRMFIGLAVVLAIVEIIHWGRL